MLSHLNRLRKQTGGHSELYPETAPIRNFKFVLTYTREFCLNKAGMIPQALYRQEIGDYVRDLLRKNALVISCDEIIP